MLKLHRNLCQLIVLQNKLKLKYENNLTLQDTEIHINEGYKEKEDNKNLSIEYMIQWVLAKEDAGEDKAVVYLHLLNWIDG